MSHTPNRHIRDVHTHTFVGRDIVLNIDASFTAAELQSLLDRLLPSLRAQRPVRVEDGVLRLELPTSEDDFTLTGAQIEALGKYIATLGQSDRQRREEAYLAYLCVDRTYRRWYTRYVPLSGGYRPAAPGDLADLPMSYQKLTMIGDGPERKIERVVLPDIRTALEQHTTFILLAPPGAGKTTVMQRLTLDLAQERLAEDPNGPIPLFVRMAAQQPHETPHAFLARQWQEQIPGVHADALTEFGQALRQGQLCILCDALNEARRENLRERLADWRDFARDLPAGNRMVFSCRTLDYTNDLAVQQVEVDPLSPEKIREFARRYLGAERGDDLWRALQEEHQLLLDLAGTPFYLMMMVEEYQQAGQLPSHRARLFRNFVARLFAREHERRHADWIDMAGQHLALAELAYAMQALGAGTQVSREWALNALPAEVTPPDSAPVSTPAERILRLGHAATLLADTFQETVRFSHHLLQEYFAAFELNRRLTDGEDLNSLWRVPTSVREMPPAERNDRWDPLPPPDTKGWEETTILAAGLNPAIVERVRSVNPALAARCLLDLGEDADEGAKEASRRQLLERMGDVKVHLRSRIEAGKLLGQLKDPRFPVETIDGVKVILPPLVEIAGGKATIGSSWWDRLADTREKPRHDVTLAAYAIGRYPVTNAEFGCFIEAGGYEEASYWTSGGNHWRKGEPVPGEEDPADWWLRTWERRRKNPKEIEDRFKAGYITEREAEAWRELIQEPQSEIENLFRNLYPQGKIITEPRFWHDAAFNNLSQPAVGICWYEAVAYANWLAALTGKPYRLPSEPEWEWAARRGARLYPWGWRWDEERLNSLEGRVMSTTPVGVYPNGATPDGIHDLSGNVWEWTASRFADYPYRTDANLEDPEATGFRMVRGGGWTASQKMVRCAYRYWSTPWDWNYNYGFRLARTSL
ncbi:MAG: SUMF1/EgtB/PvdO family nonheme iron enzyme [Caldilineaceae bacterium]|nr:SUMF1/EgtB/PvdO family nonheme iron enzyme [Caldilineaceae bacterium]